LDWLTFFSTDIKSLVWPTAAIIALFVLKNELRGFVRTLANRLQSFKGFGVETTFGEAVDQVEELLPATDIKKITASASFAGSGGLGTDAQRIESAQRIETISESTQLPPPYIVSQAWLRLEQAIREAVDIRATTRPGNRRPPRRLDYLNLATVQGLLIPDETPAVHRLREMRNLAAHSVDPGITMTDALRYQDIADALIEKINQRSRQAKPYLDQADTPTPLRGEGV
jgi:hypothetical protein